MTTDETSPLLPSDLWLDQPDAEDRIEERREAGEISPQQAEGLLHFARQGYLTFHLENEEGTFDRLLQEVDRLWKEKPVDLAFAYRGDLTSMADGDEARDRQPLYRIADLHSHSQAALDLYLHPDIFAWVSLIFDQAPVAFQSLFFEYGSQQSLHRDPVYVVTSPPGHLVAAWIALEDIGPDCGPLAYIPGSHKLPYYEFAKGRITIEAGEDYDAAYQFTLQKATERGLSVKELTCRRGDVFLWHSSLVHGGSEVRDPAQTRKSFVVHYSTLQHYRSRGSSFLKRENSPTGRQSRISRTTAQLMEKQGCKGIVNPLKGFRTMTLRDRLQSWRRWLKAKLRN